MSAARGNPKEAAGKKTLVRGTGSSSEVAAPDERAKIHDFPRKSTLSLRQRKRRLIAHFRSLQERMDPKSAPDCCDGANASRTKDAGAGPLSRYVHYVQKRCQLTQHWHLTECSRHHPVAVVARLWIKLLAFTLFQAFAILHGKLYRLGKATFQELRKQIYRSLFCGRPFRLFSG